jgi:predicted PurR-regulated permease PerM
MGSAVELHPLVILVELLVGSELLGPAGALLAIPVAATAAVIFDEIRRERVRSQMELGENGAAPGGTAAAQASDPVALRS